MNFATWIDTFNAEKGINTGRTLEVEGPSGTNMIPVECLVDVIKSAPSNEQRGIKDMLVKIDFMNKPVMPYYEHLARAIAQ